MIPSSSLLVSASLTSSSSLVNQISSPYNWISVTAKGYDNFNAPQRWDRPHQPPSRYGYNEEEYNEYEVNLFLGAALQDL